MKYGCIGEHLSHSFSKTIHEKIGEYDYVLHELTHDELEPFMRERDFLGINVTIPYKQAVIPYLDFISETAHTIGAVNTIVNREGKLYGHNTDFGGMVALFIKSGMNLTDRKVLIAGTGGTSKTALAVVKFLGAREAYRVSRTGRDDAINYDDAYDRHSDADFLVNATPCGMFPDINNTPFALERFTKLSGVLDAIYNPLRSCLVTQATSCGANAIGGLYMLVSQAVLASEIFLEKKYDATITDAVFSTILAQKQNIVLTGMPGSGKTTIGRILAAKHQREFIDTDSLIVRKYGPISEIFRAHGEKHFREIEAAIIREISVKSGCVIATGGGAILRHDNINALKMNGKIYFLNRPPFLLVPTSDRPLATNAQSIAELYAQRATAYRMTADEIIYNDTTADSAAQTIERCHNL